MIIILNAPPATGKDTIADMLQQQFSYTKCSFKKHLFKIAHAILGHKYDQFLKDMDSRIQKEVAQDYLGGLSPRQFFIKISEEWIKPLFGNDYFGNKACEQTFTLSKIYVFSDGGFEEEVLPLLLSGHHVMVVRLHRDGFTFEGDSRDYLPSSMAHATFDIELEEGNAQAAVNEIAAYVELIQRF